MSGNPIISNIVETRSKKAKRSELVETRRIKKARQTRSAGADAVQDQPTPTLPAPTSQPVQSRRAIQPSQLPPPRIRSQRFVLLHVMQRNGN